MGAEKRLQRLLDKANKGTGITTQAIDSRQEVNDVAMATKNSRKIRKMEKLKTKVDARNAAPQMGSALYAKLTAGCKAAARRKFDVYPSAYANMWASKQQKKGKC